MPDSVPPFRTPAVVADRLAAQTPAGRRASVRWRAAGIAGAYGLIALLWIYFSDRAMGAMITAPDLLVTWSVYKGFVFVGVTMCLLYVLMRRVFGRIESGYHALRAHEVEIERLRRLYSALSQINQAIVRLPGRDELLNRVCAVLVEQGGFRMAWVAWASPDDLELRPVAAWGDGKGYVDQLGIRRDDTPGGKGPIGRAFLGAVPVVSNRLLDDPTVGHWRDEARRRGFRALAALPIRQGGEPVGVLAVYADVEDFFKPQEMDLLTEAAIDVSFALDNLAREQERNRAESLARREKLFSDTMVDSMPGILYFYDTSGRFLRWNRNFETVSGFSGEEIARMHPLDFFAADEKPLLQERIAEVFTRGESSVEAHFQTKDGRLVPYYFTGRRVDFGEATCLVGVGIDVTERRAAEAARRESEERFNAFMDASPAIAWMTDEEGRHLYMNRAWSQAFGLEREPWYGKTAHDLVPAEAAERIRRSDAEVLARGHPLEIAEDRGVIQGRSFVWNCFKFPFRNASGRRFVGGIAIDITERKRAEEELRDLRGRFEVVIENLREGVIIADPDAGVSHWNPASLRLLGFDDIEEGRRRRAEFGELFELSLPDGTPLEPGNWPMARVRRGEAFQNLELCVRRRDRAFERILSYTGARVAYGSGRLLAFMTLRDITERKRVERLLREANATLEQKVVERTGELQAALVRAEAADRIKSAFLATMSHELRTPLNSIIGFTGIVLQGLAGPLNPEQSKQLGMVRGSARHLLELINDVLDISKIEAGQLEVRSEPFAFREALERVTQSVRPLAEKKGLSLTVELGAAPTTLVGDRRRLEQILINLLNNGIKFTERGGVSLTVLPATLPPPETGGPDRPALCLRVTDTGIGIKPHDLASLFQPFRQIDTGLSRQHEGTGLGLAICRRLAELMGGEITATSEWGQGSTFSVLLPLNS